MAENIKLNKEVFNKRDYEKTINTSFNELGTPTIQEQLSIQPTVTEFFNLYNELFYEINELGPTNSHEFLIKTSGEYINAEINNELVEALQNEIAQLRQELLETQQQLSPLETTDLETQQNIPIINSSPASSGTSGISSGGSSGGGGY